MPPRNKDCEARLRDSKYILHLQGTHIKYKTWDTWSKEDGGMYNTNANKKADRARVIPDRGKKHY